MDKRQNFDSPWKEAITLYFRPFLEFFFPDIAADVDWAIPVDFLEQELRQVLPDDEVGRRDADVLVRVYRLDGMESWVLIHVEVQSQWVADFEERMWVFHSRIRQRHARPVCCLAIYGDDRSQWKPDCFAEELWGCQSILRFRTAKLLEFAHLLDFPSLDDNPFAVLVAAHLAAQREDQDSSQRRIYKFRFVRELLDSRCERETVKEFLRLLDWLLALSVNQDKLFWRDLKGLEEEQMSYITSFERKGIEQGRQEGRQEGRLEGCQQMKQTLVTVLESRFGGAPPSELMERLSGVDELTTLGKLVTLASTSSSLGQFTSEWDSLAP